MTKNSHFVMFYPESGLDPLNPGFCAAKRVGIADTK